MSFEFGDPDIFDKIYENSYWGNGSGGGSSPEATELGLHPTGSCRPGIWRSSGLVDRQRLLEALPGTSTKRWGVSQISGAYLEEGTAA